MAKLTPPRAGIPVGTVTVNGASFDAVIHPEWLRYLTSGLFDRVGGVAGAGTDDLLAAAFEDAGIEEAKACLYRLAQDIGQSPAAAQEFPPVDVISTLADLREQIAVLRTELEGLRQGILV